MFFRRLSFAYFIIFILLSILQSFGISKYINVAKKDLIYFPGLGQHFMFGKHIKLARNWEEDKDTIDNLFKKMSMFS